MQHDKTVLQNSTKPHQNKQHKKNKTEQNWGVCNTPSMNANEGTTNEKLHKVKATPHTLTHHHTQFADRLSPTFNYLCAKAVQCVCLCKTEINKCTLNQTHTHEPVKSKATSADLNNVAVKLQQVW